MSLLKLFYPDQCSACDDLLNSGEKIICTNCRHALPLAHFHTTTYNPIVKLLYGRTTLETGAALFYFDKKTRVQRLIHNLKYKGQEKISSYLGEWLGAELLDNAYFKDIDCVIPVPLHRKRLKSRGYNQVAGFGKAIANALQIPYNDTVLYRKKATNTQVFLNRMFRSSEVIDSFALYENQSLAHKHVLLVDDLITTGGTIEGCALALKQVEGLKVSVAVMAIAV